MILLQPSPGALDQIWMWISANIHTVGWTGVLLFVAWLWRASIKVTIALKKQDGERENAMKQLTEIHSAATNHLPTAMKTLGDQAEESNKHLEEQTKVLGSINTGIAVLVDRGRAGIGGIGSGTL